MSLGGKVKNLRGRKNMSQRELADLVEVSQTAIASLEADKSVPNVIMLQRIAKVLEVDINELLSDERIIQNNSGKAIGNIHSQVTINNHIPDNVMEILLTNQEKLMRIMETQNKLLESLLKR